MSTIFVSHSSDDDEAAKRVHAWLEDLGHSVFLDFDLNRGIVAGGKWEEVLYRHLKACRAVVVLCSRSSMDSKWCFMEITHARALGKPVFPLKIDDCEIDGVLEDTQLVDMTRGWPEGFRRLESGLLRQGVDPKEIFGWHVESEAGSDTGRRRSPYPGLLALQERHAGVFFGRDDELHDVRDALRRVHRYRNVGMVVVSGASGTGKSSLVRAGIVPRLRRLEDDWLVVDPFRPLQTPFAELASVLAKSFERLGAPRDTARLEATLRTSVAVATDSAVPDAGSPLVNPLVALGRELRRLTAASEPRVILTVDQFEELLDQGEALEQGVGVAGRGTRARERGEECDAFLRLLRDAVDSPGSPLLVLATLRDDFLGLFNRHRRLQGLSYQELRLAPMSRAGIRRVIEGPAEMAGIELEPELVDLLHEEASDGRSLPLLAFALRKLDDEYGDDWKLELDEYRRSLGSLAEAVGRTADELVQAELGHLGYKPGRIRQSPQAQEKLDALRLAFLRLVRVSDDGTFARRPTAWQDLPREAHALLQRFIDERLLVAGGEERTVEVAHEALFDSWGLLKRWLNESHEALKLQREIRIDAQRLEAKRTREAAGEDSQPDDDAGQADEDFFLRGSRLARALELIASEELVLEPAEQSFVDASYEASVREQKAKETRNHRVIVGLSVALVLILAVAAWGWVAQRTAADARDRAAHERDRAEAIQGYFEHVVVPVEEERRSYSHPDLSSLVRAGADQISALDDYPDFQARMLDRWATAFVAVGDTASAEALYRQAAARFQTDYDEDPSEYHAKRLIGVLLDWTLVLPKNGAAPSDVAAWQDRLDVGRRALAVGEATLPDDPLTVRARGELAADRMRVGDPDGWTLLMTSLGQTVNPPKPASEMDAKMKDLEARLGRLSFLQVPRLNPQADPIYLALQAELERLEEEDGVQIDDELRQTLPTALEALAEHYYLRSEPRMPGLANHLYRCAEISALEQLGERNILTLIIQRSRARFLIEQENWPAARDLRRRLLAARIDAMSRLSPLESSIIEELDRHVPAG